LLSKEDGIADQRIPRYGSELEKELAFREQGMDIVLKEWAGDRAQVFVSLPRPRKAGQGWRCTFRDVPPPAMQQSLVKEAQRVRTSRPRGISDGEVLRAGRLFPGGHLNSEAGFASELLPKLCWGNRWGNLKTLARM
jgi:hypothetical protein